MQVTSEHNILNESMYLKVKCVVIFQGLMDELGNTLRENLSSKLVRDISTSNATRAHLIAVVMLAREIDVVLVVIELLLQPWDEDPMEYHPNHPVI